MFSSALGLSWALLLISPGMIQLSTAIRCVTWSGGGPKRTSVIWLMDSADSPIIPHREGPTAARHQERKLQNTCTASVTFYQPSKSTDPACTSHAGGQEIDSPCCWEEIPTVRRRNAVPRRAALANKAAAIVMCSACRLLSMLCFTLHILIFNAFKHHLSMPLREESLHFILLLQISLCMYVRERDTSQLLVHSLHGCSGQSCACLKPGASSKVLHMGGSGPGT